MITERVLVAEKRPEIRLFHPDWWHTHGRKMTLDMQQTTDDQVVIRNGLVAKLIIANAAIDSKNLPWRIQWSIVNFGDEVSTGNRKVNHTTLLAAFGLTNGTPKGSEWLIERYGGTCAEQGNFIRWQRFLNIPGSGTGMDGDSNISLEIDKDMQEAVLTLLSK